MTELSPSARKLLEDADENGFLPSSVGGLKGGAVVQVRKGLLDKGLIESHAGGGGGFRITDAGRAAIGGTVPQKPATQPQDGEPAPATATKPRTPRENSKAAQLITALRSEGGATVDELSKRFGWQPHTTRAAISTLPKKDAALKPTSEKVEGRGRVYRLAAAE